MKIINKLPQPFLQKWIAVKRGEVVRLYENGKPTESYYLKVGAKCDGARLSDGALSYNEELAHSRFAFEVFPDASVVLGTD